MPLFFILSGFCLTLAYGKKKFNSSTMCCGLCRGINRGGCGPCQRNPDPEEESTVFDSWQFYFNRMTRIMPVYYFCYFFALPLIFVGHSYFSPTWDLWIPGCIEALFFQSTMVISHGFGPNAPGWTVCTLVFFYWMFPRFVYNNKLYCYVTTFPYMNYIYSFLVQAQRWSSSTLSKAMAAFFYLQLVIGMVIFCLFIFLDASNFGMAYWIPTAHPFTRIPLFFMGCCAGLLCLRRQDNDSIAINSKYLQLMQNINKTITSLLQR
jgi:peptidoglycan/LPS O-acetylase OafA/YrhL